MRKSSYKYLGAAAALMLLAGGFIYGHKEDFGLGRNMELAVNMMRELSLNYVDSVDTDKLMEGAAAGMVRNLDPYTEFIPEKEVSEFEMLTTGKYGGIGSLIRQKGDYVIIAQPYEGSPADKAGLKIGDRILSIGNDSAKGFTTEQVSARLKGEPNTAVQLTIERLDGTKHELQIMLERIPIPAISYSGWVADGVGYIRHDDFTDSCAAELRAAIEKLKKEGELHSLILDYRGNGGGFMQEAVKIVSLFTPRGTEVVRTKGRNEEKSYKTTTDPVYPDLRLVLLVNGGSASASEIVAGSLQDLDRAVLVGQRTLGKGLVQTTLPLGYNAMLKLTTAKYYIPSGRCIQAIDYSERQKGHELKKDTAGGIMPDIEIKDSSKVDICYSLYIDNYFFDYATRYHRLHDSIAAPDVFELTEKDIDDFCAYLEERKFSYETETSKFFADMLRMAENEDIDSTTFAQLKAFEPMLKPDFRAAIERNIDEVKTLLGSEIVLRYYYQKGQAAYQLRFDKELKRALQELK